MPSARRRDDALDLVAQQALLDRDPLLGLDLARVGERVDAVRVQPLGDELGVALREACTRSPSRAAAGGTRRARRAGRPGAGGRPPRGEGSFGRARRGRSRGARGPRRARAARRRRRRRGRSRSPSCRARRRRPGARRARRGCGGSRAGSRVPSRRCSAPRRPPGARLARTNSGSISSRNAGLLSRSGEIRSRSTASCVEQLAHAVPLVAVRRVDRVRADPEPLRGRDLVAHEGEQRRDQQRRPGAARRAGATWQRSTPRSSPSPCAARTARGRVLRRDARRPPTGARGTRHRRRRAPRGVPRPGLGGRWSRQRLTLCDLPRHVVCRRARRASASFTALALARRSRPCALRGLAAGRRRAAARPA